MYSAPLKTPIPKPSPTFLCKCPLCGEAPDLYPYHVKVNGVNIQTGYKYLCCNLDPRNPWRDSENARIEWNKVCARFLQGYINVERNTKGR